MLNKFYKAVISLSRGIELYAKHLVIIKRKNSLKFLENE